MIVLLWSLLEEMRVANGTHHTWPCRHKPILLKNPKFQVQTMTQVPILLKSFKEEKESHLDFSLHSHPFNDFKPYLQQLGTHNSQYFPKIIQKQTNAHMCTHRDKELSRYTFHSTQIFFHVSRYNLINSF